MACLASRPKSTVARVVISPPTITIPVLQNVSHATRDVGSCARQASSTESLTASQILSGWPSVTDSDVKRYRLMAAGDTIMTGRPAHQARSSSMAGGARALRYRRARHQYAEHPVAADDRQLHRRSDLTRKRAIELVLAHLPYVLALHEQDLVAGREPDSRRCEATGRFANEEPPVGLLPEERANRTHFGGAAVKSSRKSDKPQEIHAEPPYPAHLDSILPLRMLPGLPNPHFSPLSSVVE